MGRLAGDAPQGLLAAGGKVTTIFWMFDRVAAAWRRFRRVNDVDFARACREWDGGPKL